MRGSCFAAAAEGEEMGAAGINHVWLPGRVHDVRCGRFLPR